MKKAALIGGVVAACVAASAIAAKMYSYEVIYYSDATMINIVGEEFVGCNGPRDYVLNGERTIYKVESNFAPCREGGYECAPSAPFCF